MKRLALLLSSSSSLLLASYAHASPWTPDITTEYPDSETAGDFDGDGLVDRVIAYPRHDDGEGLIAIRWGTGTHQDYTYTADSVLGMYLELGPDRLDADGGLLAGTGISPTSYDHFGTSPVAADFDGDGQMDLAFGVPGADVDDEVNAGKVVVIYGKSQNTFLTDASDLQVWDQDTSGVRGVAEDYDFFGEVLETGDFDCDGFADLAIGAPQENIGSHANAGAVHVLYGSSTGLTATGDSLFYQGYQGIGGSAEAHDHFGAALAAGHFDDATYSGRECDSLAIGAPGEDVGSIVAAGAVHVMYAADYGGGIFYGYEPVGSGGTVMFHQDSSGIPSPAETDDGFGAALGKVSAGAYDSLWVGVPGEATGSCEYDGTTQVFPGSSVGVTPTGTYTLCQSVRLDAVEAEAGMVVEKFDEFGRWLQYIPPGIDLSTADLMIVAHGTNKWSSNLEFDTFTPGRANANKYMGMAGFIPAAVAEDLIVIAPQFEDWNFDNNDPAVTDVLGGYRGLQGRDIDADEWIELIADRYEESGLGTGKFYMFGQSAGGQFVNRYVMQNQDSDGSPRLLGAGIMAPGSTTMPDGDPWPGGMDARVEFGTTWGLISMFPVQDWAEDTIENVPVAYVVGENDSSARVQTANDWVDAIFDVYNVDIPICIRAGGTHSGAQNHRNALLMIFPSLAGRPEFTNPGTCL